MSELQSQKASDEEKKKFAKMLTENYEKMNLNEEQVRIILSYTIPTHDRLKGWILKMKM